MQDAVSRLLDEIPLWQVFMATVLLCLVSLGAGFQLGRRLRSRFGNESETPLRNIVAADLALQTLLLAFTFNSAANHFNTRNAAILEEVDSLKSVGVSARRLPAPARAEALSLLRNFVEARAEEIRSGSAGAELRSGEIGSKIEALSWELEKTDSGSREVDQFAKAIDDYQGLRVRVESGVRIPPLIWIVLYLLSLMAMVPLGFHAGLTGSLRVPATLPLVVSFSMVLVLIADLDSPKRGQLRMSEAAFLDARSRLDDLR